MLAGDDGKTAAAIAWQAILTRDEIRDVFQKNDEQGEAKPWLGVWLQDCPDTSCSRTALGGDRSAPKSNTRRSCDGSLPVSLTTNFLTLRRFKPKIMSGNDSSVPKKEGRQDLSFTVQTIDCITCLPVFHHYLGRISGVLEVKELPITNKIIVIFDSTQLDKHRLEQEINKISQKAGFGGKLIFHR